MSEKLHWLICLLFTVSLALPAFAADVDPSLVAWWKLDDGSGDVAMDSSGNNNDATLLDGPTWGTDPDHRGILLLDGEDDHAYIDGTPFELPSYSVMLWFRVDGGSGNRMILSGKGPTGVNGFLLQIEGDGTLRDLHRFPFSSGGGTNIYSTDSYDDGAWHHVATVKSASDMVLYVDGQQVGTEPDSSQFEGPLGEIWWGTLDQRMGRMFPGPLDDIRIYRRTLSEQEIQTVMEGEPEPLAYAPDPADGAVLEQTWANLQWGAGDFAVSHDLYFGTNFDDVNNGAEGTFAGNTMTTFQVVGFPGFPAPDGLAFGVTYYWRVDEINDAHADSPWKGEVWSFSIPPQNAYDPEPADGAKFLEPPLTLSWKPAFGSKLNYVYFGDNIDEVSNATGAAAQAETVYDPGTLELGKTYYWRVDGYDGIVTYKGDVWSFTMTSPGGGLKGEYYNNTNLAGEPVLTRIDPVIDFSWGSESPDPNVLNAEKFSVRWRGELEVAFTEPYRFYAATEDGVRLWIDDALVINRWYVYRLNEYRSDLIDLQAGQKASIEMWTHDNDETGETDSATAQLMWESDHQPKGIIPSAAFSLPLRAGSPIPANGAIDVSQTLELHWTFGEYAAEQEVYFGTDATAVADADTSTAGIYQGRQTENSFSTGKLDWNTTYYWRVDEINDVHPDSPWKGPVWSFTTADFLIVDNFEGYTDNDADGEAIWQNWIDGFGVADNGSQVGYLMPPYAEQTTVHSGSQSMPLLYDNTLAANNSEAELTLTATRDWTEEGVVNLSLWFYGDPANAAEPMYMAVANANGSPAIVAYDDPSAVTISSWTEWVIPLQAFADRGINLTNVDKIVIGLGAKGNATAAGGSGTIYIDDIRLKK